MRTTASSLLLLALTFAATAADNTIDGLINVVRAGIAANQSSQQIAKSLSKLKLSERLDDRVIEELESEGAGRPAVEEMERLQEDAASKHTPKNASVFDAPKLPTQAEMKATFEAAREYALKYSNTLPNFLCTEFIRRYEDVKRGQWTEKDTLTVQLSYADQAEDYKLIKVNGMATSLPLRALGGATTEGEFGTLLYSVFSPDSGAKVQWDHWTHLRGRPTQVYSFDIAVQDSGYRLEYGIGDEFAAANAGSRGLIYIDPETHAVMRIAREATGLPKGFPITLATTILDYDFGDVGGRRYLLPLRVHVRMSTRDLRTRNEVDFTEYRKFESKSTITFGDVPDPIKH